MRAALVDPEGRILLRQFVPTPAQADVPASLTELLAAVAATPDHGTPSHAVVGLPGAVDYAAGRLLWAPNLPKQWPAQLSTEGLTGHLGLPVSIANDADLAAVGEAAFGAGAASSAVAYLTISTGIGAGVVHGGRLLRGTRSLAEVGHVVVDWRAWREGLPCTVEDLGSGSGVARLATRGRARDEECTRGARTCRVGRARGPSRIWQQAIAACAAGVSNLVMSFYPSTVDHRRWDGPSRKASSSRCATWFCNGPVIIPTTCRSSGPTLGDDAGLSGAAAWADAATAAGLSPSQLQHVPSGLPSNPHETWIYGSRT